MLHGVVCVFGVCFHGDFCCAGRAPQVEPKPHSAELSAKAQDVRQPAQLNNPNVPEDLNAQVCLSCHILFGCVELCSLVHIVATGRTPNAHGKHHANFHGIVLRPFALGQLRRIEIRRKVLVQHLSLSHADYLGASVLRVKLNLISDVSLGHGFDARSTRQRCRSQFAIVITDMTARAEQDYSTVIGV